MNQTDSMMKAEMEEEIEEGVNGTDVDGARKKRQAQTGPFFPSNQWSTNVPIPYYFDSSISRYILGSAFGTHLLAWRRPNSSLLAAKSRVTYDFRQEPLHLFANTLIFHKSRTCWRGRTVPYLPDLWHHNTAKDGVSTGRRHKMQYCVPYCVVPYRIQWHGTAFFGSVRYGNTEWAVQYGTGTVHVEGPKGPYGTEHVMGTVVPNFVFLVFALRTGRIAQGEA